jgi:hypothetical protein
MLATGDLVKTQILRDKEAFSNTVYGILLICIGKEKDRQLLCRTIYALFVTFYSPLIAWLITKTCANKTSYLAMCLQFHALICPVMLAWGWKDWADAFHAAEFNGIVPDVILACSATLLIVFLQALPCFGRYQKAMAIGGEQFTLLASYATVPASLNLTVGYCWNLVATHPVGKIKELHHDYDYIFTVQLVYALLVGALAGAAAIYGQHTDSAIPRYSTTAPHIEVDTGAADIQGFTDSIVRTTLHCGVTIMSFVYAWAFLHAADEFGFGVMFRCASAGKCSQQNNLIHAVILTAFLIPSAILLHKCKEFGTHVVKTIIGLQTRAMVLAVGWFWMNWYLTFMSYVNSHYHTDTADILNYVKVLVMFLILTSLVYFAFQRTHIGMTKQLEDVHTNFTAADQSLKDELKNANVSQAEFQSLKDELDGDR